MKKLNHQILSILCLGAISIFFFSGESSAQAPGLQLPSLDSLLNVKISAAAKYEQTSSEAPASVTIITSEDIERYGYRTVDELLASVRGFYTRNDRSYTRIGVRGFSRLSDYNNRILLLINGLTINESLYGAVFAGVELGLDMDIIDRVEIVRGPGSALYGTGAMLAVINIITKKGNNIDGFKVSAGTGSFGRVDTRASFGKRFTNGLDVMVSGTWTDLDGQDLYFVEYDDPATNNGIAQDKNWEECYGLRTSISYGNYSLQAAVASMEKGIPTGTLGMPFNDPEARSEDEHKYVELKYDGFISADKKILLRGYFNQHGIAGTHLQNYDINTEWVGGELQFTWDCLVNNRLTLGSEFQDNFQLKNNIRDRAANVSLLRGNFPYHVFSFYLQDEYQVLDNLALTVGIRHDNYSTGPNSTTPRAAVVFNPLESSSLKLLYGEAFRAPNPAEVHFDIPMTAIGNPDLEPEKVKSLELVWEQRLCDELFALVSVYHYKMSNLIDFTLIDPVNSIFQFRNISKVRGKGLELGLNARLKSGVSGYFNYNIQTTDNLISDTKLSNSPRHTMRAGFITPFTRYLFAATELQYDSERLTIYDTKTDGYLLTNLNLSTQQLFDRLKCSLLIRNLFNISYQTPGSTEHLQHGIPQDRRNYTLKLEYRF